MKKLLLFIALLLAVTTYSQEKPIKRTTEKVTLFWITDTDSVYIQDNKGNLLHSKIEVVEVDSTVFKGHQVILLYGINAVISFSELYIAYDTPYQGFVYLQPRKD